MKIIKSKKSIGILLAVLVLFLLLLFFSKSLIQIFIPNQPILIAGNFDLNQKKIPLSVEYIDFTFSEDLDKKTISKDTISISPNIEGNFSLINSNTARFILEDKLNIGDIFLFTFSDKIESSKGKNIDEISFELEVVSNAKVIKINPEGNIDNLNQNISVFFSLPMVPFTDLESRDDLACPIKISPEVKGKCSWTTTSVLEFVPEEALFGSSDYEVLVNNVDGLLYPLVETATGIIKTPRLDFYFNDNFNVNDGIKFSSNFDVSLDEINEKIKLYDNKGTELNYISSKDKNNFTLKLIDTSFDYETSYNLKIDTEINSVNGNVVFNKKINKTLTSYSFLNRVEVFKNIYSSTGELIDNNRFYIDNSNERNKYIPTKDVFFNLTFQDEVLLNKSNFSFFTDDNSYIDFDLSYVDEEKYNEETRDYEVFTNKKKIKFTLKSDLINDKEYRLVVSKNINEFLKDDIINYFYTSKELVITDFKFLDYSKSCLYLSNSVNHIWNIGEKVFSSLPESRKIDIYENDYIPRDIMSQYYNMGGKNTYSSEVLITPSTDERINYLSEKGYCRPAKSGEYLYVLNTRLNPNSKYELNILNNFEDKYGNKLSKITTFNQTTSNILDKDKYLYSSVSKDINVIPNNLPIVVNLQTINLDKVELEVCEMDEIGFMDWTNNYWKAGFTPKCINSKKSNIDVKNNYWNLTFNKIDLENDFLKKKFDSNFILVNGSIGDKISFSNIYIRSNISITYEGGENKQLFFITDYDSNLLSNLDFSFYSYNYTTRNVAKVEAKVKLNEKTKVFENIGAKPEYDYVIVKDKNNKSNIGFLDLRNDILSNYDFKYISGETTGLKKYLYLYTERPIYKPGDTVYFKGLLREFKSSGYTSTDIKKASLELVGPSGKTILSQNISIDDNSNFNGEFIIPQEVDLGKFSFRFNTLNGTDKYTVRNNAFFHIEEYTKPVFKINIGEDKKDFVLGENLDLSILAEYYFGGKVINTTGEYSILTQNYFFDAKDYSDYNFGEGSSYFDCIYWGYCNYNDYLTKSGNFKINQDGEYKFSYKFEGEKTEGGKMTGEKIYNFNFDIVDPDTSKVVSKTVSKVLHNTDSYVGIKSNYYNSKEKGILLDGIVLDFDAKEKANKNIKIELIKKEYKSVKKKGVDGIFYNDYSLDKKLESTYKAISDNKGAFSKILKTKTSGEYEIRVIYTGENNKEFVSSKTVYVAGEEYVEWYNGNNDITDLTAEKVQVNIGDKADYLLKSPVNTGKALIVIEKDSDILDYFIHDIKTYSDKITIDVKDTYYPNFYIKAFLIGTEKNNPLPIYKRALTVTKVSTEYKKLNIEIQTDKEKYLPQEQVDLKIKVKDYLGNPVKNADLSISIVDESLLALKGNPRKNPYAFFYDLKRYLGISTYSSLKNLIEKLEVKDLSDGEKGGAGEQVKGGDSQKKRGEFRDTAFWQASGKTDENGFLNIKTSKLPDNLTTWVIEVLANTKYDTKLGVNYDTIITSKEILINDNLPNFFGSKDTIILSPVIFNKTGEYKTFDVELNITNAKIIGDKVKSVKIEDGGSLTVNFEVKIDDIGISQNSELFTSKINIKASTSNSKHTDEIEKFVKIVEVSTPEYVSTFGKTSNNSFEEKISLGNINSTGKLTINYGVTLLNSLLDGIEYLNNFPYGSSENKTSVIMPNVFIKKLYNSVGIDFDLSTKMIKYWAGDYIGYAEKSLEQVINEYLVNIRKYQKIDGGFVYFYDLNYGSNYSDFSLSSYILESAANIRDIGFKLDEKTYYDTIKYLKNRFYANQIEGCNITKYNDCKYSKLDRLKAIGAILDFDNSDYEAFKMYKLIDFKNTSNSIDLEKSKIIAKLLKLNQINSSEKKTLEKEAKDIINKIISEELVFNPKGAYLGKSNYYSRFRNTVSLLETISIIGLEKFDDIDPIIDNVNRWLIGQKQNGSFGSSIDNIAIIKGFTKYLESSSELKNIKNFTKLKLNNKIIDEKQFNNENKLEVFSKTISSSDIKDENSFVIEKNGNGTIYYDLNLSYYKDASEIKSREEGFFIKTSYYKYDDYKKIESLKNIEWQKYLDKEISYEELQYPKNIFDYLFEVKSGKVGDLLVVRNKIITTETRDNVAFEGFIPSGAELVNPNLDTSSKKEISSNNFYFDKVEYRLDRIFAYNQVMTPGIFDFTYLMRLTHSGDYSIKPSRISEFYNLEVFGRNEGKIFNISN